MWERRRNGKCAAMLRKPGRLHILIRNSNSNHSVLFVCRLIFVSNHLPLIVKRDEVQGWVFEWDEDALIAQAREGLPEDTEAVYVGCLPVEVEGHEQDVSVEG